MPDERQALDGRFREASRYANFGNVINSISAKGIRCHTDTTIEIRSPITAFSGLNGTGKTTLLQLAAAAYKSSQGYNISSFLSKGPLDQQPFTDDASVQFQFQGDSSPKVPLTLSYSTKSSRWQGYGRRQPREVFFFGVGFFLPSNERRDFVFRNAAKLSLAGTLDLDQEVRTACAQILSCGYDGISSITVKHRNQKAEVLSAKRGATSYSEAHMGCGEGRVHSLVRTLEACPAKSLILLEEPEISLHQSAEYELGKYLIGLANRKYHQILITTHSERLMRALPQASLVHLKRHDGVVMPIPGIASREAESLMTDGFDKALVILVEDESARITLQEVLRHTDLDFLRTVDICVARYKGEDGKLEESGKDAIRRSMKTLSEAGLRVSAVLDGDEIAEPAISVYTLPGTRPPEDEIVHSAAAQNLLVQQHHLDAAEMMRLVQDLDCHEYFSALGRKVACDPMILLGEMARAYAQAVPVSTAKNLVSQLREEATKQKRLKENKKR